MSGKIMAMNLRDYLFGIKQLETYLECLQAVITQDIAEMPEHRQRGAVNRTCYAYMAFDQHIDFLSGELAMNKVTTDGMIELTLTQAKEIQHFAESTTSAIEVLREYHIDLGDN